MPIQADAKVFLSKLNARLKNRLVQKSEWNNICLNWKMKYPVVQPKHYEKAPLANVYCFVKN